MFATCCLRVHSIPSTASSLCSHHSPNLSGSALKATLSAFSFPSHPPYAAGLKGSLSARSFKKELIVSSTDRNNLLLSAHLDSELRALGFGHLLFVSLSQASRGTGKRL